MAHGFKNSKATLALFLDIERAFDKLWITVLISRHITAAIPAHLTQLLSSSYVCHGVRPPVDPFRSHVSRILFRGLPRFLLPVGE
jgi:hypothetical protein